MAQNTSKKDDRLALVLIGMLFFTIGYITWTNGALIPILKLVCNLKSDVQAYLVATASYAAYTIMALPAAALLRRMGFKNGIVAGIGVIIIGSLIVSGAANTRSFPLFLSGLFVQFTGLTVLQTAINPYVSILGPIESAARRISIMGLCNKAAGMLAPLVLGAVVLKSEGNVDERLKAFTDDMQREAYLSSLSQKMVLPYLILIGFLIIVGLIMWRSKLPELADEDTTTTREADRGSIFRYPYVWYAAAAIFFYVGVEVIAGDAIGQFSRNLGVNLEKSTTFTAYTLGGMLLGYLFTIACIPRFISQERALQGSAILGLLITIVAFFSSGTSSIYLMAALGIVNAPMWPAIFPLGVRGLGRFTKLGGALLIMGISGGAIMPLLFGKASVNTAPQQGFWVIGCCYAAILFFAFIGYKIGYRPSEAKPVEA